MTNTGAIAADQLRLLIERIEKMEEDKAEISADIKDTFAEAKAVGFSKRSMKHVIKLRKMDKDALAEMRAENETYEAALGLA